MAGKATRAALLFHEKVVRADGAIIELIIWRPPRATADRRHGLKYRLYFGRDGKSLVRYDNESGKGDQQHTEDVKSRIDSPRWRSCGAISKRTLRSSEASMKRKIEVTVGNVSGALDRFERAWQRGVAGKTRSTGVRLTFESLPVLLKNLTTARWTLLEALKRSGPMSINELARLLGRNYKNVHTDVTRLIELELIDRAQDQQIAVAWDTIAAEMKLAA